MKRCLYSLLLMLMTTGINFAQQQTPNKKVHIYILAGQSNMAGRGTPEAVDTTPYGGIRMLNKAGEWVPAREPMHFDKPAMVGTGPGFAFARAIADKTPDAEILLVPCAVGGTRIDLWMPGAYDSATKTHPYDDALQRIRKAMPAGELKAIIWHQGESDSNDKLSAGYEQKLAALVQRFRTDLHAPSLPFIMGEIAHFRTEPNPDKVIVNTAIRKIAASIPYCGFVETNGLHFDSPSAREIGKRYAAVYLSMKKP